ncbi:tubulin-specific chaperone C [Rhizoctonia solani]|uniref:Tubulin-specific chaperone C n=1 Tax=Rhizoctonia solani TaxID=456999 RepID=A0A8H8NVU3_9AGAM|nr:tubulin-specific chaperone C [Rhizoctonia solani]QRW19672.1 tubulin-specific chaperone C [Rhizoctonia solani]
MNDHFDYTEFITTFKAQAQGKAASHQWRLRDSDVFLIELEDALPKSNAPDAKTIDQFSSDIGKLRLKVTEAMASGRLPAYDQRLSSLEGSLAKLRANAKPKSKFSFKSSVNAKPASQALNNGGTPTSPGASLVPKRPSTAAATAKISINNHDHKSLTFTDAEGLDLSSLSSAQSVVVTIGGLSNCFVDLASGTPPIVNALHVQGLKRTVLYAGKIQGSVLLHDCIECTIIVSTHQFRMHTSNATNVFLEVLSNPVIEKCNDIRFGTYPPSDGTVATMEPSRPGMSGDSLPYVVQDFDWMGATPSPHWSTIGSATFHLPITASDGTFDSLLGKLLPQIASSNTCAL